jgi:hypothetical protein
MAILRTAQQPCLRSTARGLSLIMTQPALGTVGSRDATNDVGSVELRPLCTTKAVLYCLAQ